MKFIISPAKKMNVDTDSLPWQELPQFLDQAETLKQYLQGLTAAELQTLWNCNDSIAQQNIQRLQTMHLQRNLTPALLAYEGIQYQYMAPQVFTQQELDYVQTHLRILSGFYGLLRPMDGIVPYRLEMQAKPMHFTHKTLYAYWGDQLAKALACETNCIVNLASKEYSKCIEKHLPAHVDFIQVTFGQKNGEKIVEKATMAKMARGSMVRYAAEHQCQTPEQLQGFDRFGFVFSPEHSTPKHLVFLLDPTAQA